jgi:hypothetical protein
MPTRVSNDWSLAETRNAGGFSTGVEGGAEMASSQLIPQASPADTGCSAPGLEPLRARQQWVTWRLEDRNGKITKPPYTPGTRQRASSTDPHTWGTYQDAAGDVDQGRAAGVGFVFTADDPYAGLDIDDCRDPGTEQIDAEAWEYVRALDSYTEVSPSGTGVHIIAKACLLEGGVKRGRVEAYDRGRYFTVTGRHVPGTPNTINERPHQLLAARVRILDDDLIGKAGAAKDGDDFMRLFQGDWSGYPSQSEGDLALCCKLCFLSRRDAPAIDRLFRRSGLMRPKWDECHYGDGRTYGEATVRQAIEGTDVRHTFSVITRDKSDQRIAEWPDPPSEEAYAGLAGEVVDLLANYTEADRASILAHFLLSFGNVVGAGPHAVVGDDHHGVNEFFVVAGQSAKARKGGSDNLTRRLLVTADEQWGRDCVKGGLSTGEGLIAAVRDPVEKLDKDGNLKVVDEGVKDKRLLVREPEFARVLTVMAREHATLSQVLRDAWDCRDLRVMTKTAAVATGPHISVMAHITCEELRRKLTDTDMVNGFANRFIWIAARRTRYIAEPEPFTGEAVRKLGALVGAVAVWAGKQGRIGRDPAAVELWGSEYRELTRDRPGLAGAILGRAEAHVLRLSMIYALLDKSTMVRVEHLRSALALWRFSERSVAYIFGDRLGDPTVDTIDEALRVQGEMSRTQIRDLFGRHGRDDEIGRALGVLVSRGRAHCEKRETGGRPTEVWLTDAGGLRSLSSLSSQSLKEGRGDATGTGNGQSNTFRVVCQSCGTGDGRVRSDGWWTCAACGCSQPGQKADTA